MAVPKRRTSKSKIRSRVRSHRRPMPATHACPQCGSPKKPHHLCPSCGHYRGRQVVTVSIDE